MNIDDIKAMSDDELEPLYEAIADEWFKRRSCQARVREEARKVLIDSGAYDNLTEEEKALALTPITIGNANGKLLAVKAHYARAKISLRYSVERVEKFLASVR